MHSSPARTAQRSGEVITLQYLRGVAAMAVTIYHVMLGLDNYEGLSDHKVSDLGSAGVDLFFVISGFIMLYITAGKDTQPRTFLKARLLRVLPLYWLASIGMFAMPLISHVIGWSSNLDPRHLLTSLLCIGGVQLPGRMDDMPVYRAGWTINYEIFFYLIFAAALTLRPVIRSAIVASIGLLALVGIGYAGILNPGLHAPGIADFYTAPILLEFVFGIAVAFWYLRGITLPRWLGCLLLLGGAAAFGLIAITLPRELRFGVPATLIVVGALALEPWARARPIAILKLIGDASYSIYLTHLFTVHAADIVWRKLLPHMSSGWIPVYFLAGTLISALGGIVCFRYVELPLHRWARRLAQPAARS